MQKTLTFLNISSSICKSLKMATKSPMEYVKENAKITKDTISYLKEELKILNDSYNRLRTKELLEENEKLTLAVEEAKKKLVQLEVKNGVKQIPVPNQQVACSNDTSKEKATAAGVKNETITEANVINKPKENKPKKEKKVKEVKPKAEPQEELPVDVGRLDLRIGKIVDVQKHPDADALYVSKINCGEDNLRTVCSGLVKHVPIEELRDRFVMVLCNLKPAKMRGVMSEAMVMCASTPDLVEVLLPPTGCTPGDVVECDGYKRQPDPVMNPKKKIFETVAPDLHVNDQLQACYKGIAFAVPGKGNISSKTLKNVPVK